MMELKKSDFEVRDKTITKIYANDTPEEASVGKNGRYVILQLSTDYELPVQIGEPAYTGSSAQHPSSPQNNMPQQTMAEMLKVRGNPPAHPGHFTFIESWRKRSSGLCQAGRHTDYHWRKPDRAAIGLEL